MAEQGAMILQIYNDAKAYRQLNRRIYKSLRHDIYNFNTDRIKETINNRAEPRLQSICKRHVYQADLVDEPEDRRRQCRIHYSRGIEEDQKILWSVIYYIYGLLKNQLKIPEPS